ncbi:MAG: hypothetical protein AAFQ98_24615 [Bacteroidota bacterium]
MKSSGYFDSPWPGEDGSASRLQAPVRIPGLSLNSADTPQVTRRKFRWDFGAMVVLREPGQVYLMRANYLQHRLLRLPSSSVVERIHPETLAVIRRSPRLKGGPMWPGGMAVHRNGKLYVVYGRYCHCLDADCNLLKSTKLPRKSPYNSFVILDNGYLVMKNYSSKHTAYLTILDPETLEPVCQEVETPEPSIARLSAKGNTIYVVGTQSIFRYHFSEVEAKPVLDPTWRFGYLKDPKQTYGWDVVISEHDAWFLDNGKHRYQFQMVGAGVSKNALNFIRVSLQDDQDSTVLPVSGLAKGTVTNPPLFAEGKKILVVYDSGNSVIRALKYDEGTKTFTELWRKDGFGCSSHMLYYPDTGELCTNDYQPLKGDSTVVLDIETGEEKFRAKAKNFFQGVLFPAPGWNRDYYYLTFDALVRVSLS